VNINRFRMTASEIAMGRYMRAPDHTADTAAFDTAFAEFASPEDKKPDAAAASGDGGAASGGAGDGQGGSGDPAGGSAGVDGGAGDGGAAAASGDAAAAAAAAEAGAADAGKAGDAAPGSEAGGAAAAGSDAGAAGDDKAAAAADASKPGAAPAAADQPGGAGPSPDQILEGLKKLVGEPKPAEAAPAAAAEPTPIYSAEETTRLAKYDEDWKEVAECEALKRRAEYDALLKHVFTQVANFVKPIQETTEALAQRTFIADVNTAVPDYSDQLRNDVIEWAKTQPTYLQVAYNHVITEGTADEVKDLVDRYRTAKGIKPAGAAPTPKPEDKGNELSDEAKKAAAKLAPVETQRSGVTNPGDPSNFDDAWKEAAGLG
jgi:hypothetical protein